MKTDGKLGDLSINSGDNLEDLTDLSSKKGDLSQTP